MMKNIGIEMTNEVYEALKSGNAFCFLTTYSDKGFPYLTPLHLLCPKNKESIIFAILNNTTGYHNMVWQKKVMFSVFYDNNISCHMLCRAGIIRAPSRIHPLINMAQIDVIDIVNEESLIVSIDQGIRFSYIDSDAQDLGNALMREIRECVEYT